jgi:hypothetical protein
MNRVPIEKLAKLHWDLEGDSPEYEFWSWLAANSVGYSDEDLHNFYLEMKEELKRKKTEDCPEAKNNETD